MAESENILLQRFVGSGDATALSEIVRRYAGLVYAACVRVLGDADWTKGCFGTDSADLPQDWRPG